MKRLIFIAAVGTLLSTAWGQQPGAPSPGAPPQPGAAFQEDPVDAAQHGVARLSLAEGSVLVTRGNSDEPIDTALNAPVVATDRVSTGDGSRAELQLDSVNLIRLAPNSEVRIGELQYHSYLIQVLRGTVTFRSGRDSDARIDLSTPNVSVSPLRAGNYRVTVRPDGQSEITVRAGEANIHAANGSERLPAGQTMLARGSFNDPEFMTSPAASPDDWDRWNADRDRLFDRYQAQTNEAARYTGPDMSGTEDLAANGHWVNDPAYGNVWVPNNVAPDWAPYRDGRWDYLDYYGWSWVSYDPWGWAPYHYGNWYRSRFGWAWYPGAIGPRHYWRPAMVGFFGFGAGGFGTPGIGLSLGFGYSNVGWVPLAPFEVYHPWYGRGYVVGRSGAIVSNINIAATYRNARYADAITGIRASDFGRTAVGRSSFVRPGSADIARAGMVTGGVPFAPSRNSFASGTRAAGVVPLNAGGSQNGASQNGGWRRIENGQGVRTQTGGQAGGFRTSPQSGQGFRSQEAQPVRISPSIVNNRSQAPAYQAPRSNSFGGFGGPRYSSPVPVQRSAPTAPRSAPSGGGNRGGGGGHGGGHR